jgi:glycosyltransferase involved in cell wall biosynthesis
MELNCKKNLNKIKISVIIPFYKRNDLVINAVKSVLNQTHKSFEIILINDGTKNINKINDFLLKYKNIKLINSPKNCGPANARNIGIRKATGKYIAFLDSDDLFLPEKLEKQIIHMELNNSDFSYTSYFRKTNELEKIIDCYCEFSEIEKHSINNCNIATPTVMIRRSVINKYSLFYDEKKEIGEDVCFYLKIFKIIKPTMLNEPLSIVNSNTNSAYLDINKQIKGIKTIINYLTEDDYYDKYQKEIADLCLNYYNLVNSEQNENTNISKNNISIKKNYLKILVKRGPIYCAKKIKNKIKR